MFKLLILSDAYQNFRLNHLLNMPDDLTNAKDFVANVNKGLAEYNAYITKDSYDVVFATEQDLTFFLLKWAA